MDQGQGHGPGQGYFPPLPRGGFNQDKTLRWLKHQLALMLPWRGTEEPAYLLRETVYLTSSDTFDKADYPGLRAVRVQVQGAGGGGGGGAACGPGEVALASSGGGGGYAEKVILASNLASSETVTVGEGGSGGSAGNNDGSSGEASSFGSHCQGNGGGGGRGSAAAAPPRTSDIPGQGGAASGGDLNIPGGAASVAVSVASGNHGALRSGTGGSYLSNPQGGNRTGGSNGQSVDGANGDGYGGGGYGAGPRANQSASAGGDGADGIVIVEVYV